MLKIYVPVATFIPSLKWCFPVMINQLHLDTDILQQGKLV
jgi:hypothetical protein